ncbi:MAG: SPFH domain-containing protein [Myxococcaceae bacterium]
MAQLDDRRTRPTPTSANGQSNGALQQSALLATQSQADRSRYHEGWRAGRPEEDPAKMKRWGFIQALPSEFLVRMRGGTVVTAGQGASIFKWPWDSVAIIPTTVQRLHFTADQITSEKVGVQVTGLAVYRIADPMIAFRMLNFSFAERASEKLETMLVEMFVGAVRRLVANLTVEGCLTRRKEGLATELMREIAPVVSGIGRPDDRTQKGWGVVIDTIEIQDVRVLSQTVFANMQARFRQEQERLAREAELNKDKAVKQDEAAAERQIELCRVAAAVEIRHQKQQAEEQARLEHFAAESRVAESRLAQERMVKQGELANERDMALAKLQAELEVKQQRQAAEEQARLNQLAAEARMAEAKLAHERAIASGRMQAEVEKARLEGEAAAARHELQMAAEQQHAEVARAQGAVAEARLALADYELRTVEIETRKTQIGHELELARARALRDIENTLSPEVIQMAVAKQLPQLAAAFQQKMGEVHVTSIDGANPFGYIAAAVEGVMGMARSAGLTLPRPPANPEEKL